MDIERINDYEDQRFSPEVLKQHGAFMIDKKYPCAFKIISEDSAEIDFYDYSQMEPIIESFRFYAEHITKFYDKDGKLLAALKPVDIFVLNTEQVQPSQFYVDEDKVKAVSSFLKEGSDIIIPVMKQGDRFISLDGHTRLYYARTKGWKTVRAFETEVNDYVLEFVKEAIKRGVERVQDMELLSHSDYEIKWNKFCDDFFADKN